MQISQVNANELGLLITGLRSIHIANQAELLSRLKIQLEQELSTRFGMMIGTPAEQERTITAIAAPAKRKYTRRWIGARAKSKK